MKKSNNQNKSIRFPRFKVLPVLFISLILCMFTACSKKTATREEIQEGQKELLQIKNNLTKSDLENCIIETNKCTVDAEKLDMAFLADLLKNTRPIYPVYRILPYATFTLRQPDEKNYFSIHIEIFNTLNINGVAVLELYLYKDEKIVGYQYYSSTELNDWCMGLFPEVYKRIQDYNESQFYYKKEGQ